MSRDRAAQLLEAGVWLKLSGDVDGARRLFQQALRADPESVEARQALAELDLAPAETTSSPPPQPGQNPFEVQQPNFDSSESTVDGDWGLATGFAPSPPPIAPVSSVQASPSNVSLTPEEMTPGRNTLSFGDSAVRAPAQKSTMMFGPSGVQTAPSGIQDQPVQRGQTLAFGDSGVQAAPSGVQPSPEQVAPGRSTMMFGPSGVQSAPAAEPPAAEVPEPEAAAPVRSSPSGSWPQSSPSGSWPQKSSPSGVQAAPPQPPSQPEPPSQPQGQVNVDLTAPEQEQKPVFGPSGFYDERQHAEALDGQLDSEAEQAPALFSSDSAISGVVRSSQSVQIDGAAAPEAPLPVTPPLFGHVETIDPPPAYSGALSPLPRPPPGQQREPRPVPPEAEPPSGEAWRWKGTPTPKKQEGQPTPAQGLPVPMPSPGLAPLATSAWDQRSNPGISLEAVTGGRALDMITEDHPSGVQPRPQTVKEQVDTLLRGAKDLLGLDDHSGAIDLITRAQKLAPDDPAVRQMREKSELTLVTMFESKLGDLATIPRVLLKDDEVIWLNLDHRAGFVLAQIDGTVSFDDLFAVSGMSRLDTARILAQLVEEGVISRG